MTSSWGNRTALLAIALVAGAGHAAAQSESAIARRTLESRWQVEIPYSTADRNDGGAPRFILGLDGRLSFGVVGALLASVDADGKSPRRAVVAVGAPAASKVVPLADGDFLVHAQMKRAGIELRRYAPDGKLRFRDVRLLQEGVIGALHDAAALAGGYTIALTAVGLGPNDILPIVLFDKAGRRLWNFRSRVSLGSEFYSRLYVTAAANGRQVFVLASNGVTADGAGGPAYFLQRFAFDGRRVAVEAPKMLGTGGEMRCSAAAADGRAVLGIVPSEARSLILQWYDAAWQPTGRYTFDKPESCELTMGPDGQTLVLLEAQRVIAFGADGAPRWRAEFASTPIAAVWMPDGDIAALDATPAGYRIARYTPR